MSNSSRRAAALENRAATILGSARVRRGRFQKAPDVVPLKLACGRDAVAECKTRKVVPRIVRQAIEQAEGYVEGAIGLGVIRQKGSQRIVVCCWLEDFAQIAGIAPAQLPKQLVFPLLGTKGT